MTATLHSLRNSIPGELSAMHVLARGPFFGEHNPAALTKVLERMQVSELNVIWSVFGRDPHQIGPSDQDIAEWAQEVSRKYKENTSLYPYRKNGDVIDSKLKKIPDAMPVYVFRTYAGFSLQCMYFVQGRIKLIGSSVTLPEGAVITDNDVLKLIGPVGGSGLSKFLIHVGNDESMGLLSKFLGLFREMLAETKSPSEEVIRFALWAAIVAKTTGSCVISEKVIGIWETSLRVVKKNSVIKASSDQGKKFA